MSKMTCSEAIYDVLAGEFGLDAGSESFEDMYFACFALASGEGSEPDIVEWIASRDLGRGAAEVALDILFYCQKCGSGAAPSVITAKAIAAGKAAM